jgi:predicted RNA-binding protein YlxR (DUF448 family)
MLAMAPRKSPIRSCVACRTTSDKRDLLRVVRTPEGDIRLDRTGKVPGRGAYLCGAKECTARALKQNKLGRALRCDLPESIKSELEQLVVNDDATQ